MDIRTYILEADPLTSYTDVTDEIKSGARKVKGALKWATSPSRRIARAGYKAKLKKLKFQKAAQKHSTKSDISGMKARASMLKKKRVFNPVSEDVRYSIDPEKLQKFTKTSQKLRYLKAKKKHRKTLGKVNVLKTKRAIKDLKRDYKSSYGIKNYT